MRESPKYFLDPDAFLIQHFVSEFGVFEVYWHGQLGHSVCTCPGYRVRHCCRHIEYLHQSAVTEGFLVSMHRTPTEDDQHRIEHDAEYARQWALRHTMIEVV